MTIFHSTIIIIEAKIFQIPVRNPQYSGPDVLVLGTTNKDSSDSPQFIIQS